MDSLKALISELRQNPLAAFCGLMVAAIVYLVLMLIEQQSQKDALQVDYRNDILAVERACSSRYEALLQAKMTESAEKLKESTERQDKIEAELRKLRKR